MSEKYSVSGISLGLVLFFMAPQAIAQNEPLNSQTAPDNYVPTATSQEFKYVERFEFKGVRLDNGQVRWPVACPARTCKPNEVADRWCQQKDFNYAIGWAKFTSGFSTNFTNIFCALVRVRQ